MDIHQERGLQLNAEPEHEGLYDWAIIEIDAQGRQIGRDRIPWPWTLDFTATSCVLSESIDIKSEFQMDEAVPLPAGATHRELVRARLRPSSTRMDGHDWDLTTFSMFGTNRAITSFDLYILAIGDPAEEPNCRAWGTVSYTAETDFMEETAEDHINFRLFVKPETFDRYATKVAHGQLDEITLSVGSVAGFYSEWSPETSTRSVKVLTQGGEQNVVLPPGCEVQLPRLGNIGTAELHINRRLEFGNRAGES